MGWQEFMRMERETLGEPLAGETAEQLDRIAEEDRTRARQGLVALVGAHGGTYHRHIDALGRADFEDGLAARSLEEGWLKQRTQRRRKARALLPYPSI